MTEQFLHFRFSRKQMSTLRWALNDSIASWNKFLRKRKVSKEARELATQRKQELLELAEQIFGEQA